MSFPKKLLTVSVLIFYVLTWFGCVSTPLPQVLDRPPDEPYEVLGMVEVKREWHALQWLWSWWHYMPWCGPSHKLHEKKLAKKARKLGADAITNIEYYQRRLGAKAEAIKFKRNVGDGKSSSEQNL